MEQHIFLNKAEQRKFVLDRRRSMTGAELFGKSSAICERLLALPQLQKAGLILSYMPTYDEADVGELNRRLAEAGKHVCYPVTAGGGLMSAFEPDSPDAFAEKRYGILEPVIERSRRIEPADIDAIILPCVAFDYQLRRLGHGAGYYDRYLPLCKKAVKIAAAFSLQQLEEVICDSYDVPVDLVVTEEKIYKKMKKISPRGA